MAKTTSATRPEAARSNLPAELSPRQRLLRLGAEALTDAELLSVLLRTGCPEALALGQAVDLLRQIGGFPGLLRIDAGSLRGLGLTPTKAAIVLSTVEMSRRLVRDEMSHRPLLGDPGAVARYTAIHHRSPDQRLYGAVFLDACCRLISTAEIFRGGQSGAAIEPAAVFRRALVASATSVIVFQTRAAGGAEPTVDDWAFTRSLVAAGRVVGIPLADHLIVASAERWVSLHRQHPW